jgi:outer membrane protein OmpA-like peptidoglycan-associated protein
MRRKMVLLLACSAVLIQSSAITVARAEIPGLPTFSQSSTGIYFDGLATSSIKVSKNSNFEVGCNDFTIDWWQKAPILQNLYPRLFQFGSGQQNGDGFAASQEGGTLYFWLNNSVDRSGIPPLISVVLPDTPNDWNHFAIVRNNSSVAIYINGVSTGLAEAGPAGLCPTGSPPHTMGTPSDIDSLDLLIGGSDDNRLGGFNGEVTGFEFLKGARWTGDFTPPTTYTTDSCLRLDVSNNCTLESLLLIYPTQDFKDIGLKNLITNESILAVSEITYGNTTPPGSRIYELSFFDPVVNGKICLYDIYEDRICSDVQGYADLDEYYNENIFFYPDDGYELESVSITPMDSASTGVITNFIDDILVSDYEDQEFTFIWESGDLVVPVNFSNFEIAASFKLIAEVTIPIDSPSIANGPHAFNDYFPFEVGSNDPLLPNDYSSVESVMIEVQYFTHDPFNPSAPSVKNFCRGYVDSFDISSPDPSNLFFWLPGSSRWFFEDCPGYHQRIANTPAVAYLFDTPEVTQDELQVLDKLTAMQSVQFEIISPPGFEEIFTPATVNLGDTFTFEPSNLAVLSKVSVKIISGIELYFGYCEYYVDIRDADGELLPGFLDANGNINIDVPSYDDFNLNPSCEFNEGFVSIDETVDQLLLLEVFDDQSESEFSQEFTLNAMQNNAPADKSPINETGSTPNPVANPSPKVPANDCPVTKTLTVNFSGGSSQLSRKANKQISTITQQIKFCGYKKIQLTGYTSIDKIDSISYRLYRKNLSFKRASIVQTALINSKALKVKGLKYSLLAKSEINAIKSNKTEKTRSANRRVEVTLNF